MVQLKNYREIRKALTTADDIHQLESDMNCKIIGKTHPPCDQIGTDNKQDNKEGSIGSP